MYSLGTEGFVQIQTLQIVQIKGCSARAITCSARYSDPCLPLLYTFIMSITDWRKVPLCFGFGNETSKSNGTGTTSSEVGCLHRLDTSSLENGAANC